MSPSVAIIGGGPCGLTLARLLERKGINYVVYERDESDTSVRRGGSLDIHAETGQLALKEAGLFEEFLKYARYEDTVFRIANQRGERVFQPPEGGRRDAPEIDRIQLRQILLDSIPSERIRWNHVLKSVTTDKDGHHVLEFTNGVSASGFKLVVGADGAWSKVRASVRLSAWSYEFYLLSSFVSLFQSLTASLTDNTSKAKILGQSVHRIEDKPRQPFPPYDGFENWPWQFGVSRFFKRDRYSASKRRLLQDLSRCYGP